MDEKKAKNVVRIIAGAILVLAVFLICYAIADIHTNNEWSRLHSGPGGDLGLGGLGNFIDIVAFIFPASLLVIASLGLWFFKNWARILLMTSLILISIASIFLSTILPILSLMLGVSIFLIYIFGFDKSIIEVFEKQNRRKK